MYRVVYLFIFYVFISPVSAQPVEIGEIDWDWSSNDIAVLFLNSELDRSGDTYEFSNVSINRNILADIDFKFDRGDLEEVRYEIYGRVSLYRRNKNNLPNFVEKISYYRPIYNRLRDDGFRCAEGWHFPDNSSYLSSDDYMERFNFVQSLSFETCSIRGSIVRQVFEILEDEIISLDSSDYTIAVKLENDESEVMVNFDEYYHYNDYNQQHVKIGGAPGLKNHNGVEYKSWFDVNFEKK